MIVIIVIVMNLTTFYLPSLDFLTKWIGGNYFSFRRTDLGGIKCRDKQSHKFSNIQPQYSQHPTHQPRLVWLHEGYYNDGRISKS